MTESKKGFFTYKGLPLVRKDNEIYYGNMSDEFVVWIQIEETKEINGIKTATKLRLYRMATDESIPPMERINKTAEKKSLYEALDIASVWLARYKSS